MLFKIFKDTVYFFFNLFKEVGEESVADENKIIYLSLSDLEILEEIIGELMLEKKFKTPFRHIIKRL